MNGKNSLDPMQALLLFFAFGGPACMVGENTGSDVTLGVSKDTP